MAEPAPRPPARPAPGPATIAAVDLGSNSFHLVVARVVDRQPVLVDRLREQVQLAAGLTDGRVLSKRARQRALECLARFGQRLADLPPACVRAVGTNTLRVARNARSFLEEAEAAFGHPIEIVSGREEARLIYLGVSHTLGRESGLRLVVDIGGGSTECILGEGFEARLMRNVSTGCVTLSRRYFDGGAIRAQAFEEALLEARLKLRRVAAEFQPAAWATAVGASGTVKAAGEILRANGWSESGVTLEGLRRLRKEVVRAGHVDELAGLGGLKPERAPVFPGGLAILLAVCESFGVERMEVATGALREGVVYDLLGRLHHEDVRERTIRGLESRYRTDREQAGRVEQVVLDGLAQVAEAWGLGGEEPRALLSWAARLHELGLAVAYERHHHHGAYLIAHSDMPGFSDEDQRLLAALVGTHRRKARPAYFEALPGRRRKQARRLSLLLRLAVRVSRGRSEQPPPPLRLRARKNTLSVRFPPGWLAAHPLTRKDLEITAERVRGLGFRLRVAEASSPEDGGGSPEERPSPRADLD